METMSRTLRIGCPAALAAIVVLGMTAVTTAAGTDQAPPLTDVKLHQENVLLGQVVNAQNTPVVEADVALSSLGRELAKAKTDKQGYFAFGGLRNGVYQVVTTDGQSTFRAWSGETAPPVAQPGLLVVTGDEAVRGQGVMRGVRNALSNPLVAGGLIAAGIVIPIAVDDANQVGSP
jgi:hypothetical protein